MSHRGGGGGHGGGGMRPGGGGYHPGGMHRYNNHPHNRPIMRSFDRNHYYDRGYSSYPWWPYYYGYYDEPYDIILDNGPDPYFYDCQRDGICRPTRW